MTVLLTAFNIFPVWGRESIVPDGVKDCQDFAFACEFLDYYARLLDNSESEAALDTVRMAKDQGFRYLVGNDKALRSLSGDEEFSISFDDGVYRVEWNKDEKILVACAFPARIDLLTFSNKLQLEDRMVRLLECMEDSVPIKEIPVVDASKLKKVEYSSFYVRDLGYFITPRLSHQEVYQPLDDMMDKCKLAVNHEAYPLECLSNYMLTGYSPSPIGISIDVSRYGYQNDTVSISLEGLFNRLSDEGSIPYWGVDEYDGKIVKGLYVWINKPAGFAHILSLDIPVEALSSSVEAKAKMNCYVRLDNLNNLFEEFR